MLVKVKDLKPNPYRRMDKYPIDKAKVESLKISINETGFWDNILARKVNNEIQIAYGHHRLQAIQELKIKEIDIPVKDLDDATMIKIMANENMTEWSSNTEVIIETIQVAKDYLEDLFYQCKTYEDVCAHKIVSAYFSNSKSWNAFKGQGIGQGILKKFLGDNWKDWQIQQALKIINSSKENIDIDAVVEEIDHVRYAAAAVQILEDHPDIKKEDQKEIIKKANKIVDSKEIPLTTNEDKQSSKEVRFKAAMEKAIEEKGYETQKKNLNTFFPKKEITPDINSVMQRVNAKLREVNSTVSEVLNEWEYINPDLLQEFKVNIQGFLNILKEKGDKTCQKNNNLLLG